MKSKSIWILIFCALLMTRIGTCNEYYVGPGPVVYQNNDLGFYVKGFGGLNWAQTPRFHHTRYRTSQGYVLGGALGYHFCYFSLEGEFSYRHNTIRRFSIDELNFDASGDLRQYCGFVNGIFDIPVTFCFAPYVGVGAGYRHIKPGVNFDERSDVTVRDFIDSHDEWGVYQVIGGLSFTPAQCVHILVDYRFVDAWGNNRCRNHSLCVAAKLGF